MRGEIDKLANSLRGDLVAPRLLVGPPGCGKTHVAREAVRKLGNEGLTPFVGVYLGTGLVVEDSAASRNPRARFTEFLFVEVVPLRTDGIAMTWASMNVRSDWPERLNGKGHLLLGPFGAWEEVLGGMQGVTRVIILDDYERLRDDIGATGFEALGRLAKEKVKFVVAIRPGFLERSERGAEEERFLQGAGRVKLELPTDGEALEIANECWVAASEIGFDGGTRSRGKVPDWNSDLGQEIITAAGNYPGLIVRLVKSTIQQRIRLEQGRLLGDVKFWVGKAQEEPSFLFYMKELLDALPPREVIALRLLVITEEGNLGSERVFKAWEERGSGDRPDIEALTAKRLLVHYREGRARICSAALRRFLLRQKDTMGLAADLGFPYDRYRLFKVFEPRWFVYLWILGLVLFTAATFFDDGGLPKSLRLLSWLPAVGYLVWFLVRRERR